MQKIFARTAIAFSGLTLLTGGVIGLAPIAQADTAADNGSAVIASSNAARFEGKTIDLSKDWGKAKACVVWHAKGAVECFRTDKERDARALQLADTPNVLRAASSCSIPLHLYADINYGGNRDLTFYDAGYWQNLDGWGFSNQVSSYKTGTCGLVGGDYNNGGGTQFSVPAGTRDNNMSGFWNDRLSSVYNY